MEILSWLISLKNKTNTPGADLDLMPSAQSAALLPRRVVYSLFSSACGFGHISLHTGTCFRAGCFRGLYIKN
jgi:hypothetical protein